jgi:putative ABC transport system substrate-binding protein
MPAVTQAQRAVSVYEIGYLAPGSVECSETLPSRAFRQGLVDAGYSERDVVVDRRCFSTAEMAGKVLDELLRANPNILFAGGYPAALAMRDRAPAIPVVFVVFCNVPDPVGSRMVQSLARPGRNMTGLADLTHDLNGKRVQGLKETLAGPRLLSTLSIADGPDAKRFRMEIDEAAATLHLQVRHLTVKTATELAGKFETMKKDGSQAFVLMQTPLLWAERAQISNLAAEHRLPGMYPHQGHVADGGFISYGADQADLYRRAAGYVTKILRGAKPRDLPVEQPTKFELVINLRTAKALGLTIPGPVLLQANHVIE